MLGLHPEGKFTLSVTENVSTKDLSKCPSSKQNGNDFCTLLNVNVSSLTRLGLFSLSMISLFVVEVTLLLSISLKFF